jgi:hypothetical protein
LAHEKAEEAYLASQAQGGAHSLWTKLRGAVSVAVLKRETSRGSEVGIHELSLVPALKREDTMVCAFFLKKAHIFLEKSLPRISPFFFPVLKAASSRFRVFSPWPLLE